MCKKYSYKSMQGVCAIACRVTSYTHRECRPVCSSTLYIQRESHTNTSCIMVNVCWTLDKHLNNAIAVCGNSVSYMPYVLLVTLQAIATSFSWCYLVFELWVWEQAEECIHATTMETLNMFPCACILSFLVESFMWHVHTSHCIHNCSWHHLVWDLYRLICTLEW